MDDPYPTCIAPTYYMLYESRALTGALAVDAVQFWHGLAWGYALALLTLLVVVSVLHRLTPRGGGSA